MTRPANDRATVDQLVSDHLYLIQHVVHDLAVRYPRHVDREELWSAGAGGLVDAARRYDPDQQVAFGAYARIRIRGAIIDSTRSRDWASRSVRRLSRDLDTAASEFEQDRHRHPTTDELADMLGIDPSEVERRRADTARATLMGLDTPTPTPDDTGGTITLADTLADQSPTPDAALESAELAGQIRTAIANLDEPIRIVVDRFYTHGHLLADIAADMGVTEARVSQLASEGIQSLRAWMSAGGYDTVPVDAAAAGKRRRAAFMARMAAYTTWQDQVDAPAGMTLAEAV